MNVFKHLRSQSGIGLVEVMMGVAISGGLALTVAKLMENASQNTKQTEAKTENINLKGLVQNILSNTTACNYTFSPLITQANLTTLGASTSNQVTVPSVKDKVNAIAYSTASTNVNPLTITSLSLTNYNSATSTADLLIQSTFRRSSTQVQMVKPIRVPLNFNINNTVPASPVLVGCSTMAVGGEWLLGGNAGTNEATDYLGTSDNIPLNFKVNAQRAGKIDHLKENAFFGYTAGNASSSYTGNGNVAFGNQAMQANNTGLYNVAVGTNSLRQSSSTNGNVAVGPNTMWVHTTNDFNTAIGYTSMQMSTTSSQNTAVGAISLRQITSGTNNSAVGYGALNMTTTGSSNVAMGHQALVANNVGTGNVGLGVYALGSNTTGTQNTAVGMDAGSRVVTNIANTFIGFRAGYQTTGANNTMIGNETGFLNTAGSANVFIGYRAGYSDAGTNKLHINNGVTTTSLIEGDFTSAARYIKIDGKLGVGLGSGAIGTPGTPQTASTTNVQLHVKGGITVLDQEGWIAIPLGTDWVSCSPQPPAYFRDSTGIVHFRGCVQRQAASTGVGLAPTLFSIPAGYRPNGLHGQLVGRVPKNFNTSATCSFYVVFDNSISLTANDTPMNTGDKCFITGISYRAEN